MLFRRICGIDLGTDTVKISDKNEKLLVYEKNMIAIRDRVHVIAIGNPAFEIYEKAPACVAAESPMAGGVIADAGNLELLLLGLLRRFSTLFCKHPDLLITAPSEISEVERRAFYQICSGKMKAKRVALIDKGIADAVGIGMPMDMTEGNMIVNLGASGTEISVISEGKVIVGRLLRVGGKKMDEDIATMAYRQYHLNIGSKTAQLLKDHLASVQEIPQKEMKVYGIHTVSGLPKEAVIPALSVSVAIIETLEEIVDGIRAALERTPPQLLEDIRKNGIYLTGGVSQLPHLADYLRKELDVPVYNVSDPVFSTLHGLIQIMGDKELQKLTYSLKDFAGNII